VGNIPAFACGRKPKNICAKMTDHRIFRMHTDYHVVRKTENDFHLNCTQNFSSLLSTQTVTAKRNSLLILLKDITGFRGPDSSVGIATGYGLDGPESNPGGDEIFRPSRPALGSTQPSVKWVPVLSRAAGACC
jgi:hypothetical protein